MKARARLMLAAGLSLFVGGYAFLSGEGAAEEPTWPRKTTEQAEPFPQNPPATSDRQRDEHSARRRPTELDGLLTSTRKQALDMYRKWSSYPPNSRPLSEEQTDIIEPHVVPVGETRLFRKSEAGSRQEPSDFGCSFQPLTHTAVEGQDELVTLSCRLAQTDPRALPVESPAISLDLISVSVTGRAPGRAWELPSDAISVNDAGIDGDTAAGDNIHTVRVRHRPEDWGDMLLKADFRVLASSPAHDDSSVFSASATYFSSPKAPARFTGEFAERLQEGSLVVDVGVDVQRAGRYRVYANLRQGDEYVGYATEEPRLQAGKQLVPLLFFGKLFHDKKLQGAFTMVDLRGHRFNLPDDGAKADGSEPDREQLPPLSTEYQTRSYALSAFSSEEWTSPRKTERLRELELLAQGDTTTTEVP
jgi:hypothetical protein